MNHEIYPWQITHWQQLLTRKDLLPHALLFTGLAGLGKKHFAINLSHALLCGKPNAPCRVCRACHLIQTGSHPNLLLVEPAEIGQMIKIDQIREAIHFANETALQSGNKFIIIHPASSMNINAANALLKTLEEPARDTIFILISHGTSKLPATITSRCQKIIFNKPPEKEALEWLRNTIQKPEEELRLLLQLASGSPLKAAELAETEFLSLRQELYQGLNALINNQGNPLKLAMQLQDKNMMDIFNLTFFWLRDLLRDKVVSRQHILHWLNETQKNISYCMSALNLNKQLLLENFFIMMAQKHH